MLNPAVLKHAPLLIDKQGAAVQGGPPITIKRTVRGKHIIYDFTEPTCRVKQEDVVQCQPTAPGDTAELGMYHIVLRPDVNGNTFYLPYGWDEIHSVRMPARPDLGTTGITTVITANLSGCCIFVEREATTNDVIFYHANTVKNSPDALVGATRPREQTGGALNELARLHAVARADYGGAAAKTVTLPKWEYNEGVDELMLAGNTANNGKKVVSFAAGTTVAAFYTQGEWQVWFQTYGRLEEYHADPLSKKAVEAKKLYDAYKVLDCRKFFP